jgi:hypothetical protein
MYSLVFGPRKAGAFEKVQILKRILRITAKYKCNMRYIVDVVDINNFTKSQTSHNAFCFYCGKKLTIKNVKE